MRGAFGLLDRYVAARFAGAYGICLLSFILLFLVVDATGDVKEIREAVDHLEAGGYSLWAVILEYYATKLPRIISVLGPYLTLFATIATVLGLSRGNELTPMITSGRSIHRVLLPVYAFAVVLAGFLVLFEEVVVPAASARYEALDSLIEGDEDWVRPPPLRDARNKLVAKRWLPAESTLLDVRCPTWSDPSGALPTGNLTVERLEYGRLKTTGRVGWYARGATLLPHGLDAQGRPQLPMELATLTPIAFDLTPDEIDVIAMQDETVLPRSALRILIARYPRRRDLPLRMYSLTTRPLSSLILLLLGLPFLTRLDTNSFTAGLATAFVICIAYFGVDHLFQELGRRGDITPALGAWFAPAFYGAIAIARLDQVHT